MICPRVPVLTEPRYKRMLELIMGDAVYYILQLREFGNVHVRPWGVKSFAVVETT
jgi:hypothetical protein